MIGTFTFLGTGASSGIPMIGCTCDVCTSKNPYNNRFRPSGLIQVNHKNFLIDVGPDFRDQALQNEIDHLDGIFITHVHFDHIAGIDELRALNFKQNGKIPCLISKESLQALKQRYHYLFEPLKKNRSVTVQLAFQVLEKDFGFISFEGVDLSYLSYFQADTKVSGYRIGNLAYLTDIKNYSEEIFPLLKGVDILIVSAIRKEASPIHFNLEDAIRFGRKIEAKKTWITHIAHEMDHEKINQSLPEGFALAHDNLVFEFSYGG